MNQKRLVSLDFLRGLTIALMIIVNNPGTWGTIYAPLRHARWHGWTPTDLVFPFFLFIVGVAIPLSFTKLLDKGVPKSDLLKKVIRRTILIWGIGLLLHAWPFGIPFSPDKSLTFDSFLRTFTHLRILGVLPRIAWCYLIASLIFIYMPKNSHRIYTSVGLILLYEMLMRIPFVTGWGGGDFTLEYNFARFIDLHILGANHMYGGMGMPFDPEGIVSTFTSAVTTMLGIFTGLIILKDWKLNKKLKIIFFMGLGFYLAGEILGYVEPINKQLWTTTYVMAMGGLTMIMLAFTTVIIDVFKKDTIAKPFIAMGSNPLIAFVGSGFIAKNLYLIKYTGSDGNLISLKTWMYQNICLSVFSEINASLFHAILHLTFWLLITWWMYKKKIFIKI
jgi:predicted acyltransferase